MRNAGIVLQILLLVVVAGNALAYESTAGESLLSELQSSSGWSIQHEQDDGTVVLSKEVSGSDLHALMVRRVVDIDPAILVQVVRAVDRYEEVLVSATTVDFEQIHEVDSLIYGYQYFHIPLLKNRQLCFAMQPAEVSEDSTSWRVDWSLVPREAELPDQVNLFLDRQNRERSEPLYMHPGSGSIQLRQIESGEWEFSYRLHMNPVGWMPNWLVERINRVGLVRLVDDVIQEAKRLNVKGEES